MQGQTIKYPTPALGHNKPKWPLMGNGKNYRNIRTSWMEVLSRDRVDGGRLLRKINNETMKQRNNLPLQNTAGYFIARPRCGS